MRLVKYLQVIGIVIAGFSLQAQDEIDALRFSRYDLVGTARYVAMGGAFGALGTDASVLSQNPAGIALYRRNEFAFSLGFMNVDNESDFQGVVSKSNTTFGRLNSISLIGNRESKNSDFSRVSFGIGYNKLVNFNERYSYSGSINGTSVLNVILDQATGVHPDELVTFANTALYADPAYQVFLINPIDDEGQAYTHEIPYGEILQSKSINRTGYLREVTLNAGAKINEHIYMGGAIAFPKLRYEEQVVYTETPMGDSLELDFFTMYDNTEAQGTGVNIKLGVIGKINDWIRVGAAYHSSSSILIDQKRNTRFESSFVNGSEHYESDSPVVDYTYNLKTPSKFQLNTAFIFKKKGLIAFDYEYINYRHAQLGNSSTDEYTFTVENSVIDKVYQSTNNFKVGAEWRVIKPVALRAGFNFQESPYSPTVTNIDGSKITYSAGFGYRKEGIYFDFAYSLSDSNKEHFSYNTNEPTQFNKSVGQAVFSVGFRY